MVKLETPTGSLHLSAMFLISTLASRNLVFRLQHYILSPETSRWPVLAVLNYIIQAFRSLCIARPIRQSWRGRAVRHESERLLKACYYVAWLDDLSACRWQSIVYQDLIRLSCVKHIHKCRVFGIFGRIRNSAMFPFVLKLATSMVMVVFNSGSKIVVEINLNTNVVQGGQEESGLQG